MTELIRGAEATPSQVPEGASAGALLRAARERSGMNVEALAATVKAAPAKIEALEADRLAGLPDLTFARGLARNVCHVLGTDPAPVLALMPQPPGLGAGLEQLQAGLRTPLRRHAGDGGEWRSPGRRPALWMALLLLLAALVIFMLPQERDDGAAPAPGTSSEQAGAAVPPAAPASDVAGAASAPAVAAVAPPPPAPVPAVVAASSPAAAPLLRVGTDEEAWVEVRDAAGTALVQRLLRAGETVEIAQAAPPLRLKIGNASAVRVALRGEPVDLAPSTRSDVARLELK